MCDRIASFALLVRDASANGRVWRDVAGMPAITYNIAGEDVLRMHRAMIRTGEMCLAAGAKRLYPTALPRCTSSRRPISTRSGEPRSPRATSSGRVTTRSGPAKWVTTRRRGVIGLDHQAHDVPGLYVVDGSTVPTAPGVNPQITIMALATRAAGFIAAG